MSDQIGFCIQCHSEYKFIHSPPEDGLCNGCRHPGSSVRFRKKSPNYYNPITLLELERKLNLLKDAFEQFVTEHDCPKDISKHHECSICDLLEKY